MDNQIRRVLGVRLFVLLISLASAGFVGCRVTEPPRSNHPFGCHFLADSLAVIVGQEARFDIIVEEHIWMAIFECTIDFDSTVAEASPRAIALPASITENIEVIFSATPQQMRILLMVDFEDISTELAAGDTLIGFCFTAKAPGAGAIRVHDAAVFYPYEYPEMQRWAIPDLTGTIAVVAAPATRNERWELIALATGRSKW